uniref:Josephin-like protein n=1 Tax=Oryza rufipogon TaxID=4529 RepID=A0A0E0N549_ORYRU
MRRKGSECTRITPETTGGGKPTISRQASSWSSRMEPSDPDRRSRLARGACGSRLLRSARWTATRFYRRARASVARAFRPASTKKGPASCAASRSPDCTPARNSSRRHSLAPVVADDSHKSEAVEECIRFMNSSSRKYR